MVNFCRYRQLRELPPGFAIALRQCRDVESARRVLAEGLLYGAGLRLADGTALDRCPCPWLSAAQRHVITRVKTYGYRVAVGRRKWRWLGGADWAAIESNLRLAKEAT
jgi:hypothetical protein